MTTWKVLLGHRGEVTRMLTGEAGVGDRQTRARSVVPDSPLDLGLFSEGFYYLYGMEGQLTIRGFCRNRWVRVWP